MRKIILSLSFSFVCCLASAQDSLQYLEFGGFVDDFPPYERENQYTVSQVNAEISIWAEVIRDTMSSIDPSLFRDNMKTKIYVFYFIDDKVNIPAIFVPRSFFRFDNRYFKHEGIYINLFPSRKVPEDLPWVAINADGMIDEVEKKTLFIHELGHYVYRHNVDIEEKWFQFDYSKGPTKRRTSYREDFADSFFIYVLWPEFLKKYYRDRYDVIDEHVGDLFNFNEKMPDSIQSMLCGEERGNNVCNKNGKIKTILRTLLFFLSVSLL